MKLRHESKVIPRMIAALMFALLITATPALLKLNLTGVIFGEFTKPKSPPIQISNHPKEQSELPASQPASQTDPSGNEHYTDKNGNEVIIVNARYEAKTEAAPIQAAPQQKPYQAPPLVSQQTNQTRNVPLQAPPPANLTTVVSNAVAKAHIDMNVFESCRCNNGLATKGDLKQDVLEKCAQPVIRQHSGRGDCREIWLYNFGPNEFMQGICFDGNRVSKVISLDHGY